MAKLQKTMNDFYDDKKSYVAKDKIWRDHCDKITISARRWPVNWGFLDQNAQESTRKSVKFNDNQTYEQQQQQQKQQNQSSPRAIPKTTNGMIGWLSTQPVNRLERYGSYARGKMTITKSFKWPAEGCE